MKQLSLRFGTSEILQCPITLSLFNNTRHVGKLSHDIPNVRKLFKKKIN